MVVVLPNQSQRMKDGQDSVEESVRMTEDRDKWRKYVHGVANARIEDGCGTGHQWAGAPAAVVVVVVVS